MRMSPGWGIGAGGLGGWGAKPSATSIKLSQFPHFETALPLKTAVVCFSFGKAFYIISISVCDSVTVFLYSEADFDPAGKPASQPAIFSAWRKFANFPIISIQGK